MATTTNYGWETPDDTDLVKDGASAIRTLGSSIDTTTKNLNPETTLGDIAYRSSTANTKTRLAIGTTGQVLTVSGGVPTWSSPSTGALTLLKTETFSAVASVSIGSNTTPLFSSTYDNYFIQFVGTTSSNCGLFFRVRANTTDATTNYSRQQMNVVNATTYFNSAASQTSGYFGSVRTDRSNNDLWLYSPFLATQTLGFNTDNGGAGDAIGIQNTRHSDATSYNGITVFCTSGQTITGTLYIYGLAK